MRLMVENSDLTMDCDKDANELRLFDRTPASDAFWKKHRADLVKSFDVVQMDNSGTRRYITFRVLVTRLIETGAAQRMKADLPWRKH